MASDQSANQSLERYVAILDVVAGLRQDSVGLEASANGRGVAEVSAALEISKGTVSRYLHRLEDAGLLVRLPDRRYVLSSKVYRWGQAAAPERDIRVRARPVLEALANTFGEPVSLFVLDNNMAMCIDQVEGHHPLRLNAAVGRRLPVYSGASPRLLLAFAPEEHQRRVLAQAPYPALTPRTIASAEDLSRALLIARRDGYVISDGESNVGAVGIAAIVRDSAAQGCAAISIAGPTERLSGERQIAVLSAVRQAAEDVSRALGYTPVNRGDSPEEGSWISKP